MKISRGTETAILVLISTITQLTKMKTRMMPSKSKPHYKRMCAVVVMKDFNYRDICLDTHVQT